MFKESVKNLFSDNYKVYSVIVFILLFIQLCSGNNIFTIRPYPESMLVLWAVFVYAIWRFFKVKSENSKSLCLLVLGLMAVIYNPLFRINQYDYMSIEANIVYILSLLVMINKTIYINIFNGIKSIVLKCLKNN